jgi:hypothetical protein
MDANVANGQRFLGALIAHCKSGKGTPQRPNRQIQCFAFEMCDEDKKDTGPGPFERYWGICDGQGRQKYPALHW